MIGKKQNLSNAFIGSESFKLVLAGDPDVGKTSLVHRFAEDSFADEYLPTLGFQIFSKSLVIENVNVDFQIWDVGGGQSFRYIRKNYYSYSRGFLLVFDLAKPESFQHLETWLAEIREVCPQEPFILVGNKSDLPDKQVSDTAIDAKLKLWGASGKILTSAKTGSNTNDAFFLLGRILLKNHLYISKKS